MFGFRGSTRTLSLAEASVEHEREIFMRTVNVPAMLGLSTDLSRPRFWDGEQTKDRDGRPQAVLPILLGREVANVTVPQANVDMSLPVHSQVELTGVTIGHGKSGLWVSAERIEAVES